MEAEEGFLNQSTFSSLVPFDTLLPGTYEARLLSTGNLILFRSGTYIPVQLRNTIDRKQKYATVVGEKELAVKGNGPNSVVLANPSHSVFIDLRNKVVTKVYVGVDRDVVKSYLVGRDRLSKLYDTPTLKAIKYDAINQKLFVEDEFVNGRWIGDLSGKSQSRVAESLLASTRIISETSEADLESFINFARQIGELSSIGEASKFMGSRVIQAISNQGVMESFRHWIWQHRDLSAHNVSISGKSLQVFDLSPKKVGLAPRWYDFVTFITSQASEYGDSRLIRRYWNGEFDSALGEFCPVNGLQNKEDILILSTIFMAYLPFKIHPDRIGSWLKPSFDARSA